MSTFQQITTKQIITKSHSFAPFTRHDRLKFKHTQTLFFFHNCKTPTGYSTAWRNKYSVSGNFGSTID